MGSWWRQVGKGEACGREKVSGNGEEGEVEENGIYSLPNQNVYIFSAAVNLELRSWIFVSPFPIPGHDFTIHKPAKRS